MNKLFLFFVSLCFLPLCALGKDEFSLYENRLSGYSYGGKTFDLAYFTYYTENKKYLYGAFYVKPANTNIHPSKLIVRMMTGSPEKNNPHYLREFKSGQFKARGAINHAAYISNRLEVGVLTILVPDIALTEHILQDLEQTRMYLAQRRLTGTSWNDKKIYAHRHTRLGRISRDINNLIPKLDSYMGSYYHRYRGQRFKVILTGQSRFGWATWLSAIEDRKTGKNRIKGIVPINFNLLDIKKQVRVLYKNGNFTHRTHWNQPGQTDIYRHFDSMAKSPHFSRRVLLMDDPYANELWEYFDPYFEKASIRDMPILAIQRGTHNGWGSLSRGSSDIVSGLNRQIDEYSKNNNFTNFRRSVNNPTFFMHEMQEFEEMFNSIR